MDIRMECIRQHTYSSIAELVQASPLLYSILQTLGVWEKSLTTHLEKLKGPPPEYIPGCFAQASAPGPPMAKYKALLETHNTPFARSGRGIKPVARLWNYLVRQHNIQPIFVR